MRRHSTLKHEGAPQGLRIWRVLAAVSWLLFSCFTSTAFADDHAPAPAAQAAGADVKIHGTVVFRVHEAQAGKSAHERATAASHVLKEALDNDSLSTNVVRKPDRHIVYAAGTPVIELMQADVQAAGDASLEANSARVHKRVRDALKAEKQRSDLGDTVFSISLVVFFGLVSLYALRKIGELSRRARVFVEEHPERVPAVRMHSLEVIGAGPLRAVLLAGLFVGRLVAQLAVLYVWLVFSFSRFDATRPLTDKLSGFVITPLFSLAERVLAALPMGLVAIVSGVLVYVLVRVIELFFANVRRGETELPWLPADLVLPVSVLARVAVVLLALVFAGPFVTGDPEGSLARGGVIVMLALALASTPLLASMVVGVLQVFGRRVRVGQELEIAGRRGKVSAVGLFDLRLRDDAGFEVRVPHLLSLLSPLRTRGVDARISVVLAVASSVQLATVKTLLLETANGVGERAEVELCDIDAGAARFMISVFATSQVSASDLRLALAEALSTSGVALGQPAGSGHTP